MERPLTGWNQGVSSGIFSLGYWDKIKGYSTSLPKTLNSCLGEAGQEGVCVHMNVIKNQNHYLYFPTVLLQPPGCTQRSPSLVENHCPTKPLFNDGNGTSLSRKSKVAKILRSTRQKIYRMKPQNKVLYSGPNFYDHVFYIYTDQISFHTEKLSYEQGKTIHPNLGVQGRL